MTADLTDRILRQGRALVRAIQPTGPFERALARLLMAAYKRRLRGIVKLAPTWVSEELARLCAWQESRYESTTQK